MPEPKPDGQSQAGQSQPSPIVPETRFTQLTMADVLALPELERKIVNWMRRQQSATGSGCTLAEAIAFFDQDEITLEAAFNRLLERGFLRPLGDSAESPYQLQLGSMRSQRSQSYWKHTSPPQTD